MLPGMKRLLILALVVVVLPVVSGCKLCSCLRDNSTEQPVAHS